MSPPEVFLYMCALKTVIGSFRRRKVALNGHEGVDCCRIRKSFGPNYILNDTNIRIIKDTFVQVKDAQNILPFVRNGWQKTKRAGKSGLQPLWRGWNFLYSFS